MNTRTRVTIGLLLIIGTLSGCADGSSTPHPDAGNGQPDADAPDGNAPDVDAPDANDSDATLTDGGDEPPTGFAALSACELPAPCDGRESFAQIAESTLAVARGTCVLEAMQERIAGTYLHVSNHTFGNGSRNIEHRFIVLADGSVNYAYREVLNYGIGSETFEEITAPPAQRCQLQPADYFMTCRNAVAAGDLNNQALRDCMYLQPSTTSTTSPIPWFTSCEPTTSTCD